MPISQIIPLIILAVVIIVLVVIFFGLPKYREKTFKLFRSVKSEAKKVSWYSWKNTRKGTLVVIVSVVALAIVIGLLDYLFSTGIVALTKIF
ncbi:MAG: preprotein translocase subunit SecE [Ruminococcaceae bacterium]|nr:preprotein translocase subunit SecE [Oscillospiraceae bacterium]